MIKESLTLLYLITVVIFLEDTLKIINNVNTKCDNLIKLVFLIY